jgi:hypothetical protein
MLCAKLVLLLILISVGVSCRGSVPNRAERVSATAEAPTEADKKAADKILAKNEEGLQEVVVRWYKGVYPALRKKHPKPVSRATYDAWRKEYFENEVAPLLDRYGYSREGGRVGFMDATENQPR